MFSIEKFCMLLPQTAEIDVREVVDYAQRISGITSAPSYWKPGMAMVGFAPPAPRPEMMRAGALSAFSDVVGAWKDVRRLFSQCLTQQRSFEDCQERFEVYVLLSRIYPPAFQATFNPIRGDHETH